MQVCRRAHVLFGFTSCLFAASATRADETCGLQNVVYDSIFVNGFDVPPAASGDLGPPLGTVPVPVFGVTPTVAITDPAMGSNVGSANVAVVGTFTGPIATGVNVNGVPAVVENGAFVVPRIALSSGSNVLTATVTTLDGLTAIAQETITYTSGGTSIGVSADVSSGPAPFGVGFNVVVPSSIAMQSFSFDFGDGSPPYTGSIASLPRHTYASAGVFKPTATVVDTTSHTFRATTGIGIYSVPQVRSQVCAVYAYLRARLTANDATGALMAFDEDAQTRYHDYLTAPGTNLGLVASNLGTLASGTFAPTWVELLSVKLRNGVLQGAAIRFSQGQDGVWRIESM